MPLCRDCHQLGLPCPRLLDTPTEISSNWLETITQIIGFDSQCDLTLNYPETEQENLSGSRPLRRHQRIPGRFRVRNLAEICQNQQGEAQHEAPAAGRPDLLRDRQGGRAEGGAPPRGEASHPAGRRGGPHEAGGRREEHLPGRGRDDRVRRVRGEVPGVRQVIS